LGLRTGAQAFVLFLFICTTKNEQMKNYIFINVLCILFIISCSPSTTSEYENQVDDGTIRTLDDARSYGTIFPIGCIEKDEFKFLYAPEKMEDACNALFDIFDLSFDTIEFISANIEMVTNYKNVKYYALTAEYNINGRVSYGAIGLNFTQDNMLYLHAGYQAHLCLSVTCNCPMENITPSYGHNCICDTPPGDCNSDLTNFDAFTQAAVNFLEANTPLSCEKVTPVKKLKA